MNTFQQNRRPSSQATCRAFKAAALAIFVALLGGNSAAAVGLVYIDADDGLFSGNPNLSPLSAIDSFQSIRDNKWGYRDQQGASGTSWEAGVTGNPGDEDAPELTMTLNTANGLVNGTSYDVYVAYVSATDANWMIRAGLTSGTKTLFDRTGGVTLTPVGGSPTLFPAVIGTEAASAVWTTAPSVMVEANRHLLLGKVGTATATGGQISVFLDDLPTSGFNESLGGAANLFRSRLDGLAFVEAGSAISLSASVNRTTGQISLSNPTPQSVQVVSYSINSAGGALNPNPSAWHSISNNYDGDSGGSFDSDTWHITAPAGSPLATTTLSEAEDASGGNTGGALTASGLNLGNAWIRTPIQDLQINLTLSNGSVISLAPQYTGPVIVSGDLNADGFIDQTDLDTFRTYFQTSVTGLTRAQAYQLGDLTGDGLINFSDFAAFRTAYNSVHGAGAFELAFGEVPEPSAAWLLVVGFGLITFAVRRRVPNEVAACLPIAANDSNQSQTSRSRRNVQSVRTGWVQSLALIAVLFLTGNANAVLISGWGLDVGGQNATLTEGVAGSFSTTVPTGDARPRALFTPITLSNIGDVIQLTGTVSMSLAQGNEQFRFGLYDNNGHATGTLSGGLWSGSDVNGWLGYMGQIGDSSALGADRIAGRNLTPTGGWHSQTGAYQVDVVSTVGTTNIGANIPYNFSLKLRRTGATSVQTDYSFVGGTQNRSGSFTDNNLGSSATIGSFDAVGFLLNASTGAGTFSNVRVDVPKELRLRVNTTTGLATIVNTTDINFDINYYEIRSSLGALNLSGWNSLDDQDPTTGAAAWQKAGGSSGVILSEFNVQGTKSIAPSGSASLGNAFSVVGAHDLKFSYALPGGSLQSSWVEYVAGLTGDYNSDGKVDAADYVAWRKTGINGQQGYTDWRANFGATSGSGSADQVGGGAPVPEPAAALLILFVIPVWIMRSRR